MSVAGDLTHRVVEKSDLHDAWESGQSLQILPLRNVVIVQVLYRQDNFCYQDFGISFLKLT